jgi:hypothetical protein
MLDCVRLTLRSELGAMWLPWCVARADRSEIIRIDAEPERCEAAMQLRVGDIADHDVRRALSRQLVRDDGRSSIDLIAARSQEFRAVVSTGQAATVAPSESIDDPAVFLTAEGPMLHEACHRACGLYEARLTTFDLRLRVDALFGPWLVYEKAVLRRR